MIENFDGKNKRKFERGFCAGLPEFWHNVNSKKLKKIRVPIMTRHNQNRHYDVSEP